MSPGFHIINKRPRKLIPSPSSLHFQPQPTLTRITNFILSSRSRTTKKPGRGTVSQKLHHTTPIIVQCAVPPTHQFYFPSKELFHYKFSIAIILFWIIYLFRTTFIYWILPTDFMSLLIRNSFLTKVHKYWISICIKPVWTVTGYLLNQMGLGSCSWLNSEGEVHY